MEGIGQFIPLILIITVIVVVIKVRNKGRETRIDEFNKKHGTNFKNELELNYFVATELGKKEKEIDQLNISKNVDNDLSKDTDYLIGSKPNMGKEISFEENDLTTDPIRYERNVSLVRMQPNIRLWGVTNAFAKAVNKRLKIIRKKNWVEKINLKILIINNKNDRVVESKKIKKINQRLNNSEIIEFVDTEHEIFMEKDEYRDILWKKLDNFLS